MRRRSLASDLNFKIEASDRLKSDMIDKIYYDDGKAYTVQEKNGHLRWYRSPNHDAGVN